MKTILALISLVVVIGCSGGEEVTDNPPPVKPGENQFETTIDKGAAISEDGAPRGKGGSPEGAG